MDVSESEAGLKFSISWDQFHRDTKALAWKLKPFKFNKIVAITRGGLIPAALIAHKLNIRYIDTVCLQSYTDGRLQGDIQINKWLQDPLSHEHTTVFVDDLADTGKTLRFLQQNGFIRCHFATVYTKPEGRPYVTTFVTEVSQDTWLDFPWE
jgi:xanthine phosphoribosyltransferase